MRPTEHLNEVYVYNRTRRFVLSPTSKFELTITVKFTCYSVPEVTTVKYMM
jgi:hypothetical protein